MAGRDIAVAVSRFGLGARPGEADSISVNPRQWLMEQLDRPYAPPRQFAGFPGTVEQHVNYNYRYNELGPRIEAAQRAARASNDKARMDQAAADGDRMLTGYVAWVADMTGIEWAARTNVALTTPDPFRERLVRFWSNHLVVPTNKQPSAVVAYAYEREAIRPHVGGKLADMLLASAKNAGMLVFLDNNISVGPNSPTAARVKVGLNENLGREILELHTLGVEGGYTQADVIALSKGITGWTTLWTPTATRRLLKSADKPTGPYAFVYRDDMHEPGPITLLGKTYAPRSLAQGEEMLNDLARHPVTARFLATKLARHFVDDDPPEKLIDRMAKAYLDKDTDLAEMTRVLIDSREAWEGAQSKLKQPEDYAISVMRSLGLVIAGDKVPVPAAYNFENYIRNVSMWRGSQTDATVIVGPLRRAATTGGGVMAADPSMAGNNMARNNMAANDAASAGDQISALLESPAGAPFRAKSEVTALFTAIAGMGQRPMAAPGPQGWYDRQSDWAGADSMLKRVEWSFGLAEAHADRVPDAPDFLDGALGPLASKELATEVANASTKAQAVGLVVASPEFQRR